MPGTQKEKIEEYKAWVKEKYPTWQKALGKCHPACKAMKKAFPELTITNGFIYLFGVNRPQEHWWLKTEDGKIVDPTKHQYGGRVLSYDEIDDDHDARKYPREKCPNCGEYFYRKPDNAYLHNETCEKEYVAYLNEPQERF